MFAVKELRAKGMLFPDGPVAGDRAETAHLSKWILWFQLSRGLRIASQAI